MQVGFHEEFLQSTSIVLKSDKVMFSFHSINPHFHFNHNQIQGKTKLGFFKGVDN